MYFDDKRNITIALVYYNEVDKYFDQSFYSAVNQIVVEFKINIYLDDYKDFGYLKKYQNLNLITVPNHIKGHPSLIREFIIKDVNTDYIAFWDSDDIYSPERLYNQYQLLIENDLDFCFADFKFFSKDEIYKESFFEQIGINKRDISIIDENYVGLGICLFKTSAIKKLLPIPNIVILDWWIGIKAHLNGLKMGKCNKVLGYYRIHINSFSQMYENIDIGAIMEEINRKIILYKHFDSYDEIKPRLMKYERFKNLSQVELDIFIKKFKQKKFRNIWGGLTNE